MISTSGLQSAPDAPVNRRAANYVSNQRNEGEFFMTTNARPPRNLSNPNDNLASRPLSAMLVALMLITLVAAFPRPGYAARKASSAEARAEKIARSVTIYRDSYGVPHIYGPSDASCVFG